MSLIAEGRYNYVQLGVSEPNQTKLCPCMVAFGYGRPPRVKQARYIKYVFHSCQAQWLSRIVPKEQHQGVATIYRLLTIFIIIITELSKLSNVKTESSWLAFHWKSSTVTMKSANETYSIVNTVLWLVPGKDLHNNKKHVSFALLFMHCCVKKPLK